MEQDQGTVLASSHDEPTVPDIPKFGDEISG
jgi:hypothetical protein